VAVSSRAVAGGLSDLRRDVKSRDILLEPIPAVPANSGRTFHFKVKSYERD